MNKLILIGNGFDLHHGIATSYCDFLKAYLSDLFTKALNNESSDSKLVEITIQRVYQSGSPIPIKMEDFVNNIIKDRHRYLRNTFIFQEIMYNIEMKVTSSFFSNLLSQRANRDWVDIEMSFYQELKSILNPFVNGSDDPRTTEAKLETLNGDTEIIKNALCDYLGIQINGKEVDYNFNYLAEENIDSRYILDKHHINKMDRRDFTEDNLNLIRSQRVMFLNFNYTALTRQLNKEPNFQHIDIHGMLGSNSNPPIFGFGDEIDEDYLEMEKTNINQFLTNIKSFGYFNNENYSNLVSFINSDSYVVYIWGHSCGLSDRTLLNMLFEHDNCAGIQPFYWKKNETDDNYIEITQNISRHFRNKLKFRNRLFNKKHCRPL